MFALYFIALNTIFAEICGNYDTKQETNLLNKRKSNIALKNFTINNFLSVLFEENEKVLNSTRRNILKNYKIGRTDAELLNKQFRNSHVEFRLSVLYKLKGITNATLHEEVQEFLFDLLEFSNYVLQNIIEGNLEIVGGKLLQLTEWHHQSLKDKILRQQSKIAVTTMERNVCDILSLCYDKIYYTDHLTDWAILLLDSRPHTLKLFFKTVSHYLDLSVHKIKTNNNFRRRVCDFGKSIAEYQRDIIDFLEEVMTKHNKIYDVVPSHLRKFAVLLSELFSLIDRNYDLNVENVKILEQIDKGYGQWMKYGKIDLTGILSLATENMLLNIRIWPLKIQNKIEITWSKIIN